MAGRGAGAGFVRAYLDNTERATAPVGAIGRWRVVLEDVAPGIYTLRIDAIDAAGKVTARAELPLKRELPEILAAALAAEAASSADPSRPAVQVPAKPAASKRYREAKASRHPLRSPLDSAM